MAKDRRTSRQTRANRVRFKLKTVSGGRLRLSVFRSARHTYAQVIDDRTGTTLVSCSSLDQDVRDQVKYGGNADAAAAIGKCIAEKALAAQIKEVVFDRGGFLYHGRVKALADAAREAGLSF
ncbi:MAG: 50S ribosomal protein L18 [Magnetococcales bacterium]|nr:50S ribosomal protein L18 [Magnetococcales bacterium]